MHGVTTLAVWGMALLAGAPTGALSPLDQAYLQNPFSFLSRDYFARFSRDPEARPAENETVIAEDWSIAVADGADPLVSVMAGELAVFLRERMGLDLPVRTGPPAGPAMVLGDRDGGDPAAPGSFTLKVTGDGVLVTGRDPEGLRDGVVCLVDMFGFRAAPFLARGAETRTPRLGLRVGTVPRMGSYRDLVFMGFNGVIISPTDRASATPFGALSSSQAIPELANLHDPELVRRMAEKAREARRYGLKTFVSFSRWDFYPADAPIFQNHPELRGAEAHHHMDRPPAGHLLCTESPLMQRYLAESVRGMFTEIPLDGALIIVGGEEFPHCFMRPAGAAPGHTNCPRCEAMGPDQTVANLCNGMARAAREANPDAVIVAWPYSAKFFWAPEDDQVGFMRRLLPGTAVLTEVEKEEVLEKADGVRKDLWDYSIDLTGLSGRAKRQIAACKESGAAVYLKSEPELAFEAAGLPYIPCMDRWFDRAEALAASGADGAWVIAWFLPNHGTTSAEVNKYAFWDPAPGRDALLDRLARRIAGSEAAAAHLRRAWRHVSEAVAWSPELPPYFVGPYYLGPIHPLCADPDAPLPPALQAGSVFGSHVLTQARGDVEVFGRHYRRMESELLEAVRELDAAAADVPARCREVFLAEDLPARWFYHTARTHANFYASCGIRDFLVPLAGRGGALPPAEAEAARAAYARWRAVLEDERENTLAAIPVVERDSRLDPHQTDNGRALRPAVELMRAKLQLLQHELDVFLPGLARQCGIGGNAPGTEP